MFKSLLYHRWQALVVMLVVAFLGCGDDGPTGPTPSGPATKLVFSIQPADSFPAGPFALAVTIQDADGITVTTATDSVTIVLEANPAGGTLSGTIKVAPSGNGIANFHALALDEVGGGYTLTASAAGLTSVTSRTFEVTSADPDQAIFLVEPADVDAGPTKDTLDVNNVITPPVQVEVRDKFGNVSEGSVTIKIRKGPSGAKLSGTTTVTADDNGIAEWDDLSLDRAGSYTLTITADTSSASASFKVTEIVAVKLTFTKNPTDRQRRTIIIPEIVVEIQDEFGNEGKGLTDDVTISIKANTGYMVFHASGAGTVDYDLADLVSPIGLLPSLGSAANVELLALAYDKSKDVVLSADVSNDLNSIDPLDGTTVLVGPLGVELHGLAFDGSVLIGAASSANQLYTIDLVTGSATVSDTISGPTILGFNGMAKDPKTDSIYAVTSANELIAFHADSLDAVERGTMSEVDVTGLAFKPNGTLLAVTPTGELWSVSEKTGKMTLIIDFASSGTGEVIATVGGQLTGTLTVAAVAGKATFSDLQINAPGVDYTLEVTSAGVKKKTSLKFEITP